MYLVGIIENKCNTMKMSRILENNRVYKKCNVCRINENNLSNFKNIKFDIVIINYEINLEKCKTILNDILNNTKIILLNIDYKENLKIAENLKSEVITYGFNKKATVTITSNDEDNIMLEFQRKIISFNNEIIEREEMRKNFKTGENGLHFFAAITILYRIIS